MTLGMHDCHDQYRPVLVPSNRLGNVLVSLPEKYDPIRHGPSQPVPLLHFFPGYPRFRVSMVVLESRANYSQFFFTQ